MVRMMLNFSYFLIKCPEKATLNDTLVCFYAHRVSILTHFDLSIDCTLKVDSDKPDMVFIKLPFVQIFVWGLFKMHNDNNKISCSNFKDKIKTTSQAD